MPIYTFAGWFFLMDHLARISIPGDGKESVR